MMVPIHNRCRAVDGSRDHPVGGGFPVPARNAGPPGFPFRFTGFGTVGAARGREGAFVEERLLRDLRTPDTAKRLAARPR